MDGNDTRTGATLLADESLFDASPEGKRRSVLFAVAVMTGFMAIVGATSAAVVSTANWWVAVVLAVVGLAACAFAVQVAQGAFAGLVSEEQVLWRLTGR